MKGIGQRDLRYRDLNGRKIFFSPSLSPPSSFAGLLLPFSPIKMSRFQRAILVALALLVAFAAAVPEPMPEGGSEPEAEASAESAYAEAESSGSSVAGSVLSLAVAALCAAVYN